ncbi:Zinc finger protein 649 [Araneus ventricosus]|uniref:Zinc finger protein 649 n=1 Tax=Araneus ventricosus TaxID=182803 RepID=A0A4Y2I673_ARAVE|nr:Zinc finger protein 649 [Araneus ventricosus]
MGPKRNVKANKRGRPPMKQVQEQKVVFAKKSKVTKPEVKKRGRTPKQVAVSKNESAKPLSLEDIVKGGNLSTCDICQGVWFSKELFEKHLLTCRLQEQIISSGKGSSSTADVSVISPKSKRKNNDQGIEEDVAAITSEITEIYASPLKKRRKFEKENEDNNQKDSGKNENDGLQFSMSNKVQSLLFASKSQPEQSELERAAAKLDNYKPSDKQVSISTSNLRKNLASSMLRSKTPEELPMSRPTRSSAQTSVSESPKSTSVLKFARKSKPTPILEESPAENNRIVTSVEVHQNDIDPASQKRAADSGKKRFQAESVIQTTSLRSGRGRRSQVQEKINQENALNSITVHSSTDVDIDNQDKCSEHPSSASESVASIVDEVNIINEIQTPQRGRRGRRPQQKVNGEIKRRNNSQSLNTGTQNNDVKTSGKKIVAVKSGRGRRAQQKDQIIIPDAIEDHEVQDENIDVENELRDQVSKDAASGNENNVPFEKSADSHRSSNDLAASENGIDPGVPNDSQNANEHIPVFQNTVFLTPLQPVKEEEPVDEVDKEEKDALLSAIIGGPTSVDYDNADDPPPSTSKASGKASSSANAAKDSNGITFNCAVCQRSFTRKYHLDRHLKISRCSGLPLPSFPCELCNRVYTRKDNLREHLRSHTGEVHRRKNHKCQYCDKAFHGQSLLAIHVRKHTGEKPFACDFCPKCFPSTGALTKHRMTHTGEKPYSCNECGRRFTLKGTLSRHLRTHTGIRPHTCNFCGKKFIQIGGLNAHMFYHTGENGFKCDDCGKVFNRKARLQMHQLYVHIKLKPFVCEHCSKPFTRKEDLNRHSVLHSGEKPFKCPTCDRRFSVKPSLKLHLLTHTKEEPRSCHECGRAFIRKDCLLRHMRKRHRDVFDKLLFDEKDEKDASLVNTRVLSEKDLTENIRELLYLLIDEPTLVGFGWPDKPVDEVLELVIQRCGHTPVNREHYAYMDRLRENAKLLFTVVIDDNAVKTLLNNQTVDEVILHVLRLAKT